MRLVEGLVALKLATSPPLSPPAHRKAHELRWMKDVAMDLIQRFVSLSQPSWESLASVIALASARLWLFA